MNKRMAPLFKCMLVLTAIAFLCACAPAATAAPTAATAACTPTTLLMWQSGLHNDEWTKRILLPAFESSQSCIKINHDNAVAGLSAQTTALDKLRLALASGEGPDLTSVSAGKVLETMADTGQLMDLTEAYDKYGWSKKIPKKFQELSTVHGKKYGVVNSVGIIGIFYNKDIYKKLGLSVPTTYAEFEQNLQKTKDAGYYGISVGLSEGWPANFIGALYGNTNCGSPFNQMLSGDKPWAGSDCMLKSLQAINDLTAKGYTNPDPLGINYVQADSFFYQGKTAMKFDGPWALSDYKTNGATFDMGFFLLPSIVTPPDIIYYGGENKLIIASSKCGGNPQACLDYMNWFLSEDTAQLVLRELGFMEPIPFTIPTDLPPMTIQYTKILMDNMDKIGGYEVAYGSASTVSKFTSTIQGMVGGQLTPAQVLEEMDKP